MAVWRNGAGNALGAEAVDMTLRLDNPGGHVGRPHVPVSCANYWRRAIFARMRESDCGVILRKLAS